MLFGSRTGPGDSQKDVAADDIAVIAIASNRQRLMKPPIGCHPASLQPVQPFRLHLRLYHLSADVARRFLA